MKNPTQFLFLPLGRYAFFAVLFFLITQLSLSAQQFYPEEMVVNARTTLNLREKPDKTSKALESLARGAVVRFEEAYQNGKYFEIDSLYAPWFKVRTAKNNVGYVYGAYLVGTMNLYQEGGWYGAALPPLKWYGVYRKDSIYDEIRAIEVRLEKIKGSTDLWLRTNQKGRAKFIIGSATVMKTGYAGPLGIADPKEYFNGATLLPGGFLFINSGSGGTLDPISYGIIATGCAQFAMKEGFAEVKISNYQLKVGYYQGQSKVEQDLTALFKPEADIQPNLELKWYGDLDRDGKPDVIVVDIPGGDSQRWSLLLSSKAKVGELFKKVCDWYEPNGD